MAELREFRSLVVASIVSDKVLCACQIGDLKAVIAWVLGHDVWTHEVALFADRAAIEILRQHPEMYRTGVCSREVQAAAIATIFGETVLLARGSQERPAGPVETLRQVAPHAEPIVIVHEGVSRHG